MSWRDIAERKLKARAELINQYLQSIGSKFEYHDDPLFFHTELPFPSFDPRSVTDLSVVPDGLSLTPRQTAITSTMDAAALAAEIASGTFTSLEVTEAFILRAIIAQVYTNCLTEILFQDAIQQAKQLDEYYQSTGKTIGPLHGVPCSVKDQCNVKGYDSSLGYIAWCEEPKTEDGVMVALMKRAGGVLISKTNVPQSLMDGETFNYIFGRTLNPNNRNVSPSGSSGGEGALIRMRGALIGVGSDIGGSVRGPANYCGVFGLKPSHTRLPYLGAVNSSEGQISVPSVLGPLTTSARDLNLFMESVVGGRPWDEDPTCIPLPWNTVALSKDTKPIFGFYVEDPKCPVAPCIRRAVEYTVTQLKAAGYTVVPFKFPSDTFMSELMTTLNGLYAADGMRDIRECVKDGRGYGKGFGRWGPPVSWKAEPFVPTVEILVNGGGEISVWDNWQLNLKMDHLAKEFLEAWKSTKCPSTGRTIDGLVCPVSAAPALPHRLYEGLWDELIYMGLCNLLQLSAASVPCTTIHATDTYPSGYVPDSEGFAKDLFEKYTATLNEIVGTPVGVQVIGRKLDEENVCRLVDVVDRALRTSNLN
ncbi:hypothetical protein HDU93_002855 [Gonapodya sp. JEL0774]|nr:hypothetical protein HDU93_002855 [Gonapodya sp. JEL0774]